MQYSSQKAHTQRGNYGTREDSAVFKCHPTWSKHGAWSELCCCRDLGETRLLTFNALYQSALQHWTGSGFPALFSLIKIHQSDFFFLSFIHFEYVQLYHVEDYKEKQVSLKLRSLNLWECTGKFVKKKKKKNVFNDLSSHMHLWLFPEPCKLWLTMAIFGLLLCHHPSTLPLSCHSQNGVKTGKTQQMSSTHSPWGNRDTRWLFWNMKTWNVCYYLGVQQWCWVIVNNVLLGLKILWRSAW